MNIYASIFVIAVFVACVGALAYSWRYERRNRPADGDESKRGM